MQIIFFTVVGDDGVGKTSMVAKYHDVTYTEYYFPTVFADSKKLNVTVDGKTVELHVSDTAVCFAIDDKESYTHAYEKWYSEIKEKAPKIPIILVGTKSDLRNDPDSAQKLVSQQDVADRVSAGQQFSKYVECSTNQNSINEVFETAVREHFAFESKQGCGCDIL
ncbi:MAG: putative Rho type small GTPase [Streblomastix strix]|uniref:Putative Rho type small GTPase n=1 Tax=Streblomastix strix TaxID=222440 RepID=A0A5J4VQF8_9EUKA|nr:MAG: putative Rho type small GTPase [Streblomastix strix]